MHQLPPGNPTACTYNTTRQKQIQIQIQKQKIQIQCPWSQVMATSCLWLSVLPNKKTRLPSQQQTYKYSCKYKYTNTIWNMNTNINTNKPKLIIFSLPERM